MRGRYCRCSQKLAPNVLSVAHHFYTKRNIGIAVIAVMSLQLARRMNQGIHTPFITSSNTMYHNGLQTEATKAAHHAT